MIVASTVWADNHYELVIEEAGVVEKFSLGLLETADPDLLRYATELDGDTYITIQAVNGTWRYRVTDESSALQTVTAELVDFTPPG